MKAIIHKIKANLNSHFASGSYYLVANVLNKFIILITIPIFSSIMSTADYGIFSLYVSTSTIIATISMLSLNNTLRNAYVDHKDRFEHYVSDVMKFSIINTIVLLLVFLIINALFLSDIPVYLLILCIVNSLMYTRSACTETASLVPQPSIIVEFLFSPVK